MLIKCGMLVLTIGATACGLLTLRQARLQAASELAQAQIRIGRSDERLWALRSQIAAQVTPSNVERMAQTLGPLQPIIAPPLMRPQPGDALPVIASTEEPDAALPPGVRVVVNTASSHIPQPTDGIGLVAEADPPASPVEKAPRSKGSDKASSKSATKAGSKPASKAGNIPAPGSTGKARKPQPPADTLIRAQSKPPAARYAKAGKSTKPGSPLGTSSRASTPTQIAMQTGRQ